LCNRNEPEHALDVTTLPMARWAGVEGKPLFIAGPCSAESEEQLHETARRLPAARVSFLRAGIWKARTRPNSFEGIGDRALPWLRRAGDRAHLKTATEVAHATHVEAALKHGIDLLWIGARTTVNPFSVQEIANALRGVNVPVLVKNPTSPDLGLWMGAVERISAAGVRALGVIHRGFSTAAKTRFRNAPMWDLVIEMRRLLPDMPMITDPSHISGRRDLILGVSQRAMDLGLDGLMIETHPNPDQAWSDATQQVTPERLSEILALLEIRRPVTSNADFNASIEELREQIDQVDHDILEVLAQRMRIVERIGESKRANNVTTLQVARWKVLLDDRMKRAQELGLDADYIKALYDVIHSESVRRQSEIMSDEPQPPRAGSDPTKATKG
jgi:chorismate mutase